MRLGDRLTAVSAVLRSRRGSIAVQIAILSTVTLGMASLGTEVTSLLMVSRQMQSAANSAATAAATAITKGYPANYTNEAIAMAALKGFANGSDNVTVTVKKPPAGGNYTSNSNAVEVVVSQPQSLILADLFGHSSMTVGVRAVALAGGVGACVIVLDTSGSQAFQASNGAAANFNGCTVGVNSSSSQALYATGGSTVSAQEISIVGGLSQNNGASVTATDGVNTGAAATANPFSNVSVPSFSGCNHTNYSVGGPGLTAGPGVYCNGFSVTYGSMTMSPGVYIIDRRSFSIAGGALLTGDGVTIVLTSSTGSNCATLSLSNGTTINLTAPATGPTADLVFFDAPNAPISTVTLTGGSGLTLDGALYFPKQTISNSNGSNLTSSCLQIVAKDVTLSGGSQSLSVGCSGQAFALNNNSTPKLVE